MSKKIIIDAEAELTKLLTEEIEKEIKNSMTEEEYYQMKEAEFERMKKYMIDNGKDILTPEQMEKLRNAKYKRK